MLKKLLLLAALLYTIALAVISLVSSGYLPDVDIDNADKIGHALAYALLCLMWFLALNKFEIKHGLLYAFSFALTYGIILEVLQGILTGSRISDIYDILANSVGVVFVSVILFIRNKTSVKKI